ncbi:hypothetical protein OC845_003352 [Tilletia horrida]|nr:hypothetical protein OC845_003352 [Tilletia horrida]
MSGFTVKTLRLSAQRAGSSAAPVLRTFPPHGEAAGAQQALCFSTSSSSAISSTSAKRQSPQQSSNAARNSVSNISGGGGGGGAGGGREGATPKVGTTFYILSSLGLAATSYGVYQYYQSFNTWPRELREPLRNALLARDRGDIKRARAGFEDVLKKARALLAEAEQQPGSSLETTVLGKNPTLKTSGIAIAYAAMLEREGELDEAYRVYEDALDEILLQGNYDSSLSDPAASSQSKSYRDLRSAEERMRAVAIAQRLGDLALRPVVRDQLVNAGQFQVDPAEQHLRWSVEELLRLVVPRDGQKTAPSPLSSNGKDKHNADQDGILLSDLKLPAWVSSTDLGASLEALGGYYASKEKIEYAVPLFLQALALLLPPNPGAGGEETLASKLAGTKRSPPTVGERCHAGVIMNNLAQLFVQVSESSPLRQPSSSNTPSVGPLEQGTAWANRGLDIVQSAQASCGWVNSAEKGVGVTLKSTGDEDEDRVRAECARAQVTLLYNLGLINEMSKNVPGARRYLQRAYAEAERYGFRDARTRCAQALARLERAR